MRLRGLVQPYHDVAVERVRQDVLLAERGLNGGADPERAWGIRLAVLVEEVGEVGRALLEERPEAALREELVQIAAVAVAWIEAIDARRA